MNGDELTIGELGRTLESVQRSISEHMEQFGRRLDQLVLRDVYLSDQRANISRIERLEQDLKDSRAETLRQVTELKAEMSAAKTRTISIVAAILTATGLVIAVISFFVTK